MRIDSSEWKDWDTAQTCVLAEAIIQHNYQEPPPDVIRSLADELGRGENSVRLKIKNVRKAMGAESTDFSTSTTDRYVAYLAQRNQEEVSFFAKAWRVRDALETVSVKEVGELMLLARH